MILETAIAIAVLVLLVGGLVLTKHLRASGSEFDTTVDLGDAKGLAPVTPLPADPNVLFTADTARAVLALDDAAKAVRQLAPKSLPRRDRLIHRSDHFLVRRVGEEVEIHPLGTARSFWLQGTAADAFELHLWERRTDVDHCDWVSSIRTLDHDAEMRRVAS